MLAPVERFFWHNRRVMTGRTARRSPIKELFFAHFEQEEHYA